MRRNVPFCLNLRETAIHEQFRSADVATVVGREKDDGLGNLFRLSQPSKWNGVRKHLDPIESKNKALVLEAFDALFNKRDYAAAQRYWSPNYIQHSAHIEPGRDGLFNLIKSSPPSLRYEHGLIMTEGDFVVVHGRYSNTGL